MGSIGLKSKIITALLIILASHVSCNNQDMREKGETVQSSDTATPDMPKATPDFSEKTILETADRTKKIFELKRTHLFSDSLHMDTFSLQILGKDIDHSVAILSIRSSKGELLYHDEFLGGGILGFTGSEIGNQDSTTRYKIAESYFDEDQFQMPYYDPNADPANKIDSSEIDYKLLKSLKGKFSVSFNYDYGEESFHWLIYSPKSKKVVEYFTCC